MINFITPRRAPADGRRPPAPLPRLAATGRIPAVDGLRALAVSAVMAFHFGLGVPGGFLGVDLFFVISGYVITRLLLIEWHRTGTIRWTRFWAARARRLFPAALLVLAAVQLWLRLGAPPELRTTTNAQTLAALTYVSNWYAIVADVGYWGAGIDSTPLTHLWSLAVEEQFYLVWPLLLIPVLAVTRSRAVVAAAAGAGAVASYLAGFGLFRAAGVDRAYLGTDTRAGALLLGVLCALALTRRAPDPYGSWDRRPGARGAVRLRAGSALAVVALTVLWATAGIHSPWLYAGGLCVAGVAAALVIGHLVAVPASAPARLLGSRPMVGTGRLSYSLYLWHWPVHVYALHRWSSLGRPLMIVAQIGATLALAILSFALVERPARTVRRPVALAPALSASALLVLGGAVCFQPAPPSEQQNGVIVHGPAR